MRKDIRIFVGMLALVMALTACQPTPEAEPVIQKDTEKLIEMAVGVTDEQAGEKKVTLSEQFPERFVVDYTTTTSGAKVTGDVKIKYLADTAFPMYRVKNALPDVETGAALARRLLGTEELYVKKEFLTRAEIAEEMNEIISFMGDEENKKRFISQFSEGWGEKYYQETYEEKERRLAELQKQYSELTSDEAPDFSLWEEAWPTEPGVYSQTRATVTLVGHSRDYGDTPEVNIGRNLDTDRGFTFRYAIDEDEYWGYGYHILDVPEDWSVACEGAKMTPQEAVNKALTVFAGIMDVYPTEVRWCDNGNDTDAATDHAYVILLSRKYDEAGCVYTTMRNQNHVRISEALEGSGLYAETWSHETITVAVNERGILDLNWQNPIEIVDVLTEEVNLLDFETIYNLFTQQVNRYLATYEEGMEVKMLRVTLGLMCIREQDSLKTGLLVPVWYFKGIDPSYHDYYQAVLSQDSFPLCVLNAIDGSVIDPQAGY